MQNKLKDILETSKMFIQKLISDEIETFNIEDLLGKKRNNSTKIKHIKKGIYFFYNDNNKIVYIGQGGDSKTDLNRRILQELRCFKKTENGNNGGTISKNIMDSENESFDEDSFKKYISKWKLKILDLKNCKININIIEAICIELYKPKYNIMGK